MYGINDANKIKRKIDKDGVFLWKMDTNFINRTDTVWYLYKNEEERNKHIEKQKSLGWTFYEKQNPFQDLHSNIFKPEDDVIVFVAFFSRRLKPLDWDK